MTLLYVIDLQNYGDLEVQFLFVEGLGGDFFREGCKIVEAMGHCVVMTCCIDLCRWESDIRPIKFWEYIQPKHLFQPACRTFEDGSIKVLKDVYECTKMFDVITLMRLNELFYEWELKDPEGIFVPRIEAYLKERGAR